MINKNIQIINPTGLEVGPVGVLCKVASSYESTIKFQVRNYEGNVKSVLSILGANVRRGEVLTFIFDGADEEEASIEIERVIIEGLGE